MTGFLILLGLIAIAVVLDHGLIEIAKAIRDGGRKG